MNRLLYPVAAVCFLLAAAADTMYATSAYLMWLHLSEWLIAVGIAFGALALVAFIFARLLERAVDGAAYGWLLCIALVVEAVNSLVHTADGWTAVVPAGIALSAVGLVTVLVAGIASRRIP